MSDTTYEKQSVAGFEIYAPALFNVILSHTPANNFMASAYLPPVCDCWRAAR